MIILYHNRNKALYYYNSKNNTIKNCSEINIQKCLLNLAQQFPKTLLIWCHNTLKDELNIDKLSHIFHHKLIMASYSVSGDYVIAKEIGYVDQHCFINVKKNVTYPTWLMSSDVGGLYAEVIIKFTSHLNKRVSFDEFLCGIAKLTMCKGLICYSEPNLIVNKKNNSKLKVDNNSYKLFRFVKKYYKIKWVFLLFLNQILYNNRLNIISLLKSLFFINNEKIDINLNDIKVSSIKNKVNKTDFKVDVLIPTLGRKEHLYNVLKDLAKQTLLPEKVIIVEQNGVENSTSNLDYLSSDWPFKIDHTFVHQLGACNARNLALKKVTGNWVFFADDDVRFEGDLLEKAFAYINQYNTSSITISCLQNGEIEKNTTPLQWYGFGTNASLVESKYAKKCFFKQEHEFGYGEDTDYGMQLKNNGCDTIYIPNVKMLHLKAPIGGFRFKFKPLWNNDKIIPKPSPTIMAYNLKHLTNQQFYGYKTILFIKFYSKQKIKNPIKYIKNMALNWNKSEYWAKKIMGNEV
ncbi:glycosyltransferase family 2 protein [Polaribacter septentrionalilitoris]|uniref:glycosyltransferase family 2 protein n=1 Tax=Polaribacter septentrionalilitoris TaxID=2494657 RepID=UPI00135CA40C|nr:glycosyltransferase family 2 protein [Polaribacter septentrionalilitoris]